MKTILFCLLIFGTLPLNAQPQRVLFLGNSYTNTNNLPQVCADIAISTGDTLIFDSHTPGGYTLEQHSTNTTSLNKIMQGNWDFVVLQEQSQRPSFPIFTVINDVFPYAESLNNVINTHNPCGETMFYMTWGRKNGDASNCPYWPPVCTYQGMDSLLNLRYRMMADSNDAVLSPVGAVWKLIRQNYPGIELYSTDGSHPSPEGTYAGACTFYTSIFRKDPTAVTYNSSLNPTDAANIRTAVKQVVYDSLLKWHIGEYDLISDFSYANTSGFTYQFTNQSQNATTQMWNFGTSTDTASNPLFTFPGPGQYMVELSSYNACDTVTISQTINVTATSLFENHDSKKLTVYPNPVKNKLWMDIDIIKVESVIIYNSIGEKILQKNQPLMKELDVSFLSSGIYFIQMYSQKTWFKAKFTKN